MNNDTAAQLSAVYAEAAIAFLETDIPQAVLWHEDEERWDFMPADEELPTDEVAFILQGGWDGQLSLEHPTDAQDEHYNALALRDEIEQQMNDEGIARALIENLLEQREQLADADPDDNDTADEERDDAGDD